MLVLGIDGGGTKTHALAINEKGTIVGSGIGSRSNYHQIGMEATLDMLETVTNQALNGYKPDMAVYCLSDCDTSLDETRLRAGITERRIAEKFACYNDAFAALRAGSTTRYGVAVICGTGFNACGIAPDGRRAKLHSLGPLTGDWGGGYTLGEAAFGAVYRADEGRGQSTCLTEMLLRALEIPDLEALTQSITDDEITSPQITSLAPLVFEAASADDLVAIEILRHQADEIAIAALAMLNRLDMLNMAVDVVLSGGVIRGNSPHLEETLTTKILAQCPQARIKKLEVPPVVGAAFLALDLLGVPAPAQSDLRPIPEDGFWQQAGLLT